MDSINLLNCLLQEERSNSYDLLAENLSLKLPNRELEIAIEGTASENNGIPSERLKNGEVNNRKQTAAENTIEI